MKKFALTLRRDMLVDLHTLLQHFVTRPAKTDVEKMQIALLAEVKSKLYRKLETVQKDYRFTLSPAQALALRLLYTTYVHEHQSYLGNRLHQIANDIHKHYQ